MKKSNVAFYFIRLILIAGAFKMKYFLLTMVLFVPLSFTCCDLTCGLLESETKLSKESRLPRWFEIPEGYSRKELGVIVKSYTNPKNMCAKVILHGPPPENKILIVKKGVEKIHPYTESRMEMGKIPPYPIYTTIEIDGITEIIEQRKAENIFYISDDKELISALKRIESD